MQFDDIYERAVERHGEDRIRERLPAVKSPRKLLDTPDARFLSAMTRCVFSAGFRWSVVEAKWDGFEAAFGQFDPDTIGAFDVEDIARLKGDTRIIRNGQKIEATIANARFVQDVAAKRGSFASWVAEWPETDLVGLWAALKRDGARLGGNTGPRSLRIAGKDTFILSRDVVWALQTWGGMTASKTSKTGQRQAQQAFDRWVGQGRLDELVSGYAAASMVVAMAVDPSVHA